MKDDCKWEILDFALYVLVLNGEEEKKFFLLVCLINKLIRPPSQVAINIWMRVFIGFWRFSIQVRDVEGEALKIWLIYSWQLNSNEVC